MQPRGRRRVWWFSGVCFAAALLVAPDAGAQDDDKASSNDSSSSSNTNSTQSDDNYNSVLQEDENAGSTQKFEAPRFPTQVVGVVRLASGEAPYPPVEIFLCGQPVGSTNKKGGFSVSMPRTGASSFPVSCDLSIHHPGTKPLRFLNAVAEWSSRSNRRSVHGMGRSIKVGTIILEPLSGFAGGPMVSVTTLEAPKASQRAYRKGIREEGKPKPDLDKTARFYEEAVAEYPRFCEAWTALGRVRLAQNDPEGARLALENAIAADGQFPAPRRMLLTLRMERQELRPAATIAAGLLKLTPGDDQARYFHALATFGLGRHDEAAASARELVAKGAGERFPQIFLMLAEIHTERGEVEPAAQAYRAYLQNVPNAESAPQIRERLSELGAVEPTLLTAR